jgi:hypothetical protein
LNSATPGIRPELSAGSIRIRCSSPARCAQPTNLPDATEFQLALDAEAKRLRKLSPAALADEAGALKAKTEAIKDEAIRRGLKKAEGQFWKLALTPPGQSNRTDKSRLLAVLGISESEYVSRFTSPGQTDWVMRCTAKKVLRTAEQEPVVLPPAKAHRAALLQAL